MMRLDHLLSPWISVRSELEVRELSLDSRAIKPGDAFVALPGSLRHGEDFIEAALAAGASAILRDTDGSTLARDPSMPNWIDIPGLKAKLGLLAARFYGEAGAQLHLTGVTGTNGKTSIVQLLAQAWSALKLKAGTSGTLGAGLHGALVAGARTTPDVLSTHAFLRTMCDAGADHIAMEVSSHALDQGRVQAVPFQCAVFTNLTRDHLDYHGSMEAYGAAKAKLFEWPSLRTSVLNIDDPFGATLYAQVRARGQTAISYGISEDAELRASKLVLDGAGIHFQMHWQANVRAIHSPLLGRFNVHNLLAVTACLLTQGFSLEQVSALLPKLTPIDGRMNRVGGGALPLLVIDYAHTPDALQQAIEALREHARGRLIVVFGCGGDRDRGKRPLMGGIVDALADQAIVTDDNPRSEAGDSIISEILAGMRKAAVVERDRSRAIAKAVRLAAVGDVVLIAGKGHERYQEINGVLHPFDDREQALVALQRLAA
jgi:UDP-N-acetylmuramoyl-L-alanyl-D-glutamate--2,6-diaminopimelate ligase